MGCLGMAAEVRPFGELFAEGTRNGLTRPKAVRGAGVKMVNMGELFAHPRLRNADMDRVPLSDSEAQKFLLKEGDLLFARQSLVLEGAGKCSIFLSDDEPVTFESHVTRVRLDQSNADPRFYFYYLQSHHGKSAIRSIVEQGAGASGIRGSDLQNLEVLWMPPHEQRAIAHILGTLDDKIELNRRRNQTMEAMARALFKDWFVDFGPVRAKMEGRDPYLPPDLWHLFPDRLDDEGKPEGWGMQPLSALLSIIGGGTPKTSVAEYWDGDIPWFSVVDTPPVSDVFVIATEKSIAEQGLESSSTRLVPKGTTIISARGTVGNLAIAGRNMTFNQSCYGLRGAEGVGDYFVYLTAQNMVDQLKSMAHGSVFSTITRQTFEAIQRPVPPPEVIAAFESLASGWFDAILLNVEESSILAQLRNTLLPKLISGELRLAEALKLAEHVP